jgi:hypothetical protein
LQFIGGEDEDAQVTHLLESPVQAAGRNVHGTAGILQKDHLKPRSATIQGRGTDANVGGQSGHEDPFHAQLS